ncbi:hypothetical protein [Roseisolibacter agri]|uniref:Transmembrane protein n=1 Tax=Roseisolibacter agri TaxID=2014610 RepID=A0AA37QE53_9BACT|nr:hypothetical protein [Roseisolibacter agri]GLC24083.1 hypothetical protein rosag_05960 [Roseisolibacter agri]
MDLLLTGGRIPLDREVVLHWLVGSGGALLLAYAAWAHASARATVAQRRGLVAAGVGFLLSNHASLALRDRGAVGIAVSLLGSALVFWGAMTLVRERQQERQHERAREAGRHGERRDG